MEDDAYFYAPPEAITNDQAWIMDPDECRHLIRVLRKRRGDQVRFVDGTGWIYTGVIQRADPSGVEIASITRRAGESEPRVRITLAPAVLKRPRLDTVVEKAAELGVVEILPMQTARTVVEVQEKDRDRRRIRWQRIALSAMKQSQQSRLSHVVEVASFDEVVSRAESYDLSLIAWEGEIQDTPDAVIARHPLPDRVLALVGPEGGFTPDEIAAARLKRIFPVSLGPRRLRADTASIVLVAWLMSALGELDPARQGRHD